MLFQRTVMALAVAAAMSFSAAPAHAQGNAPGYNMILEMEVNPAMSAEFDEAWKTIRDIADADESYTYSDNLIVWRNMRWWVTPVKDYADAGAVEAARNAVLEAGGKKYQKAVAALEDAIVSRRTWLTKPEPELSFWPEGFEAGPFLKVDTFYFRPGALDEVRSIIAGYKALNGAKGSRLGYQISWSDLGADDANAFSIISYAADPVAMAEAEAADNALFEGDATIEKLNSRWFAVVTHSETGIGWYKREGSVNASWGSDAEE